ncbi:hypothetical protein H0E87_027598 [Populus deltoides]|uniref:Uncharacterized protein n=1 Tax=Populus deltoides TaxID=3696 RepID=A0A8T2X1B8_POPDE|nr:hypothetical protein H0E87_027598 [Populus deltoides]
MANTHLTDIRIDSSAPASHMGGDGRRPADGAESNEINQLQGERISDVAIVEIQGSAIEDKEEVSLPLWLSKITEENTESENNRTEEPCIPKVPVNLKKINEECYSPLAVSIGPYHYSDREGKLKQVERLKVPMMFKFVNNGGTTIKDLYLKVKQVLKNARGCYCKSLTEHFNDEEFNKMMFIDGCFILQFMHCMNVENEDLEMSDQQIFHVKRDLLLLENQLPFAVLHSLRTKRYGDNLNHSNEIINNFISLHIRSSSKPIPTWVRIALTALGLVMIPILLPLYLIIIGSCYVCLLYGLRYRMSKHLLRRQRVPLDWFPPPSPGEEKSGTRVDEPQPAHPPPTRKEKSGKRDDERQPAHLLELLYYKSMYHYSKSNHKKAAKGSRGHCLYYSAQNLKKAGILFRARWTGAITDVKFKSSIFWGTLKVPPIIIDESTKSLLLNLVAFETSAALDQLWVSSYICFMDSLIDDAKDVEELRSNGIIINYFGADQKVANLFNDMGRSMTHDTAAYNDIKMEINEQCESTVKRWVYEWKRTYFSNPWTIITVLAASFGLALTATQTYYTRYPPV